jgi:hypothetical protein
MTVLRPLFRNALLRSSKKTASGLQGCGGKSNSNKSTLLGHHRACYFATQSGDDATRPTALAKIFLEDGTELTGRSFGSHEAVEGEVRINSSRFPVCQLFLKVNRLRAHPPSSSSSLLSS